MYNTDAKAYKSWCDYYCRRTTKTTVTGCGSRNVGRIASTERSKESYYQRANVAAQLAALF